MILIQLYSFNNYDCVLSGAEPFKDVSEHNTADVSTGTLLHWRCTNGAPLFLNSNAVCLVSQTSTREWIMKDLKFMRSARRWVMWTFCRLLKSLFAVRTSEGLYNLLKRCSASSVPSAVRSLNIDSRNSHRLRTKSGLFMEMKTICSCCWCLFSYFTVGKWT